jgi:hypothetical protein
MIECIRWEDMDAFCEYVCFKFGCDSVNVKPLPTGDRLYSIVAHYIDGIAKDVAITIIKIY